MATDYEQRLTCADNTVSAYHAVAVTKSDTTIIPTTKGLYVGGTGAVVVTMNSGATPITFAAVPAGAILPIQVTKVLNATAATNILALY